MHALSQTVLLTRRCKVTKRRGSSFAHRGNLTSSIFSPELCEPKSSRDIFSRNLSADQLEMARPDAIGPTPEKKRTLVLVPERLLSHLAKLNDTLSRCLY